MFGINLWNLKDRCHIDKENLFDIINEICLVIDMFITL